MTGAETEIGHGIGIPYAMEVAIFLVSSVLIVPLFQFLRVSPILGFLLAGVLVGPSVLGLTSNERGVDTLAKFGVVFLLFTIGLELSFERLKAMRHLVFGLGAAQVGVTTLVIGLIAWFWGNSVGAALIIGAALALSSTAMVLQLLVERGAITRRHGRVSFAVLLFQDLAVVPVLILINVIGNSGDGNLAIGLLIALAKAVVAIGAIIILGRFLVHHMFRIVATTKTPETFVAMTLLIVLSVATITEMAGLSMELGAFLVGLLLSETEYRHQVESDIAPFKGLLLGLFFISVGMGLDFAQVAGSATWIVLSILGLILFKSAIAVGLAFVFGLARDVAIKAGLLLAAGGEFAFVILATATQTELLDPGIAQFMIFVASFSMLLTPALELAGNAIAKYYGPPKKSGWLAAPPDISELVDHVIIAGFGRVGKTIAQLLGRQKIGYLAIDTDATRIWRARQDNLPAYFGDATRSDVLERVGAGRASVVLITLDSPEAARKVILALRKVHPKIPIIARAKDVDHARELHDLGAKYVILETFEASLQLAGLVMREVGQGRDSVSSLIERMRAEEYEGIGDWRWLQSVAKNGDDEEADKPNGSG